MKVPAYLHPPPDVFVIKSVLLHQRSIDIRFFFPLVLNNVADFACIFGQDAWRYSRLVTGLLKNSRQLYFLLSRFDHSLNDGYL